MSNADMKSTVPLLEYTVLAILIFSAQQTPAKQNEFP